MLDQTLDRPQVRASTDVTLVARGVTVTAGVEASSTDLVVVRPYLEAAGQRADVSAGDAVELYWIGDSEERTLAGRVSQVEAGPDPRWHFAVQGPAESSQRRRAVRGRVQLPVEIPWAGGQLLGSTIDLSEAGLRALVDGWGVPMDPGTRTQVVLEIDDDVVRLPAEAVWTAERGAQWLMALKFVDLPERTGDLLRKRVFRALRDERAAEADR
jgi:hypothetical protein